MKRMIFVLCFALAAALSAGAQGKSQGATPSSTPGATHSNAPAGTPAAVIQKLNAAANDYIRSEKGKKQFFTLDLQAGGGSPDDAKAFVASEIVKWGPLIKKVNIRM